MSESIPSSKNDHDVIRAKLIRDLALLVFLSRREDKPQQAVVEAASDVPREPLVSQDQR